MIMYYNVVDVIVAVTTVLMAMMLVAIPVVIVNHLLVTLGMALGIAFFVAMAAIVNTFITLM